MNVRSARSSSSVEEKDARGGHPAAAREGERDGRWVLLDFLDVVVHVQHSEERVFYALDRVVEGLPDDPVGRIASGDPGSALAGPVKRIQRPTGRASWRRHDAWNT
jgi:ribosome-associated protein